ncbi:MAG: hypothetical protein ABW123_15095 [Cystobacter sp.]
MTTKLELRLTPGSESVLRLIAVPPTELSLKLVGSRREGRTCTLTLRGTHKNLPPDTVCNVLFKTTSPHADSREHTVVGVPMRMEGTACTVEVEVDTFEAGLFGQGRSVLTVVPDFPLAQGCTVSNPFEFNHPLRIDGLPLEPAPLFGQRLTLEPTRDPLFRGSKLVLSVFHSNALKQGEKPKMAPETQRFATFDWGARDDVMHWRLGCAESDGTLLLLESKPRDDTTYDLRLELLQETEDEEHRYLVWEKPRAIGFKRPVLSGFELGDLSVRLQVQGIAPGFALPLELSIWRWTSQDREDHSAIPAMYRLRSPVFVEVPSSTFSWSLLFPGLNVERKNLFALLRIPKTLSGTEEYVPLSAVFDYDASHFLPFDDEQLWLEPPKPQRANKSKPRKTPKELATALASQELKFHPIRTPDFGDVRMGVREDKLLVSIKLIGDPSYWSAAAPVFAFHGQVDPPPRDEVSDARGPASYPQPARPPQEIMTLTAFPSPDNPRLYEALVPLSDKRLLGQTVSLQGKVSHPGTMLWTEKVAAPPAFSIAYEAVPRFSGLEMKVIELTDDTSHMQFRCHAHHMPNGGKQGALLEFRVYEKFSNIPEPIALTILRLRYDLPKGKGGTCDAHGVLQARLVDEEDVARVRGKGRFRVEARVANQDGKVLSHAVPALALEFGGAPRTTEGKLIYETHPLVKPAFKNKVLAICTVLGIDPNHLMACMAFETGEKFSAKVQHTGGAQAYGLIQFTKAGASDLGKTLEELRAMTEVEQLDYVQLYMSRCIKAHGPLKTLSDVYMAILCPAAVGKPEDHICYKAGTKAYTQNRNLDHTDEKKRKGYITKADATTRVKEFEDKGRGFLSN